MFWNVKVRVALLLVAVFLLSTVQAWAGRQGMTDFLQSREIVCTVQFEMASTSLNAAAQKVIDGIVAQLADIDKNAKVVRVEGFASSDGAELDNLSLSMERAKSVEDYLREKHHLPMDRYLIGRGVSATEGLALADQRRVEIAVYDNVLNIETSEVDRIVIDGKRD